MWERWKNFGRNIRTNSYTIDVLYKRAKEGKNKTGLNSNFISWRTFRKIFKKIINSNDVIVNLGAGVALDYTKKINYLNEELYEICKKIKPL